MCKLISGTFVTLLCLVVAGGARAQPTAPPRQVLTSPHGVQVPVPSPAIAAAKAGLIAFRKVVRLANDFHEMGFKTLAEVDRATLGQPYARYMVRLDELGRFAEGGDPVKLLHRVEELTFPVVVDGTVRSSLTVSPRPGGWKATAFGAPHKTILISHNRALGAKATALAPAAFVLVEVPAMKLAFLGYIQGGTLLLRPLLDYPAYGLKANVTAKAAAVFSRLAPFTRAYQKAPG